MKYDFTSLLSACKTIGIELDEYQVNQFVKYYEFLLQENEKYNLTRITELEEVIQKHFLDSLLCTTIYDFKKTDLHSMIDIGSGAGFPGIPLKIVFPEIRLTMMDSVNKKVNFLNEAADLLEMKNVQAVHGRAEDFGHDNNYREKYDLCVSRAVANLSTLSEYCIPFIKKNGYFISYKAEQAEGEINAAKKAIKVLGGKLDHVYEREIPDTDIKRCFIVIRKEKNTSEKFPRKAGLPSKEPIK